MSVFDEPSYTAIIEVDSIDPSTMTDAGIPVSQLEPIGDAILTPGHPSPVGRTPEGDLAYPVHPGEVSLDLTREQCAWFAWSYARETGITEPLVYPLKNSEEILLSTLLKGAAPRELFSDSAHGELAWKGTIAKILAGDFSNWPDCLS